MQAYRNPVVTDTAVESSEAPVQSRSQASQPDAADSEFARRLAKRYNPRHSKPGTSSDQRAADVF